ncbi:MAG: D-glycero-beta-D-manno-heptose 1-phosphate adenylyltransferase [Calditrichia bacterium]
MEKDLLISKIKTLNELLPIRSELKKSGRRVVFSNGVFDILHRGHVEYLTRARQLGDVLIIGLNSDASVRRIKGPARPIVPQEDRAVVLAGLAAVDYICFFEEDTPQKLIAALLPDVLVKGADYRTEEIVGFKEVTENGGTVQTIELTPGRSTTDVVGKVIELFKKGILK